MKINYFCKFHLKTYLVAKPDSHGVTYSFICPLSVTVHTFWDRNITILLDNNTARVTPMGSCHI